ncbi:SRPBCC domain-containing protein [Nonomuraea sp. NBC_01738]|uniref:SRPBCC family protein n=1 Tax=Nonomuraea sp. NBC_01738 TaxID=2976003 RepID=UPI002E16832B|nr:SRPBCC domain-containing protein [Nonomuraea sp. NBC_01738]
MSVTSLDKDLDNLTLTLIADFAAPIERVWDLWADPRQLERWWGPPAFPAKVTAHDLTPGGEVTYVMTGPGGETSRGWWRVSAVNPPKDLEFTDGFSDADGKPVEDLPSTTVRMRLSAHGDGTRMEMSSVFDSREQMEELIRMGAAEGVSEAVGQMDALLAD